MISTMEDDHQDIAMRILELLPARRPVVTGSAACIPSSLAAACNVSESYLRTILAELRKAGMVAYEWGWPVDRAGKNTTHNRQPIWYRTIRLEVIY